MFSNLQNLEDLNIREIKSIGSNFKTNRCRPSHAVKILKTIMGIYNFVYIFRTVGGKLRPQYETNGNFVLHTLGSTRKKLSTIANISTAR